MSQVTQIDTSARIKEEALQVRDEQKPNNTVEKNDFYNRCLRFKKKKKKKKKKKEKKKPLQTRPAK